MTSHERAPARVMLNRKVDLAFPIPSPEGPISSVTLRALTVREWDDAEHSVQAQLRLVADASGLALEAVMELDDADHTNILDALADLSIEARESLRNGPPNPLTLIPGGKHDLT